MVLAAPGVGEGAGRPVAAAGAVRGGAGVSGPAVAGPGAGLIRQTAALVGAVGLWDVPIIHDLPPGEHLQPACAQKGGCHSGDPGCPHSPFQLADPFPA